MFDDRLTCRWNGYRDEIEPQRRRVDRPFIKPRQRQGAQLSDLPSGHCLDRSSEGQGPTRLHFDDDQSVAIACDEIDFSDRLGAVGPPVAIQNEHPRGAQMGGCDLLSAYAQRSSVIDMVRSGHTDSIRR